MEQHKKENKENQNSDFEGQRGNSRQSYLPVPKVGKLAFNEVQATNLQAAKTEQSNLPQI